MYEEDLKDTLNIIKKYTLDCAYINPIWSKILEQEYDKNENLLFDNYSTLEYKRNGERIEIEDLDKILKSQKNIDLLTDLNNKSKDFELELSLFKGDFSNFISYLRKVYNFYQDLSENKNEFKKKLNININFNCEIYLYDTKLFEFIL